MPDKGKPVFILVGGPPSNQTSFLQLALPGLQRLAGWQRPGLPVREVRLAEAVSGQREWTQFVAGRFEGGPEGPQFRPTQQKSRLQSMAEAEGCVQIPQGVSLPQAGALIQVQVVPYLDLERPAR